MKSDQNRGIETLIIKYLKGELTYQESERLNNWRKESDEHEKLFVELADDVGLTREFNIFQNIDLDRGSQKLQASLRKDVRTGSLLFRRIYWTVAASLLLLMSGYWLNRMQHSPVQETPHVADVEAPEGSMAVLTLANGEKVVLDSVNNGIMAIQGQVQLEKSAAGEIIYTIKGKEAGQVPSYNLLENPRGSNIISVMLSDGTKIWLNSESSLRYPTFFQGERREIEISGEAYLEVAHDAKHPFIVRREDTKVTVLGTRFNMNTYDEEPQLIITLLEGKVSVAQREESAILLPGQQAAINRIARKISVSDDIDAEDAIAWLNGQFVLDGTQLKSLMDQISRWYNVDVIYKDKVVNRSFGGMIDRNVPLSRMLEALRENGIGCRLEGRKVIIEN